MHNYCCSDNFRFKAGCVCVSFVCVCNDFGDSRVRAVVMNVPVCRLGYMHLFLFWASPYSLLDARKCLVCCMFS